MKADEKHRFSKHPFIYVTRKYPADKFSITNERVNLAGFRYVWFVSRASEHRKC